MFEKKKNLCWFCRWSYVTFVMPTNLLVGPEMQSANFLAVPMGNSQKSHQKSDFMAQEAAFNARREIRGDHCVRILNAL
jgi:hypothetical protein